MKKKRLVLGLTSFGFLALAVISFAFALTRPISEMALLTTVYTSQLRYVLPLYVISLFCALFMLIFAVLFILTLLKKQVLNQLQHSLKKYICVLLSFVILTSAAALILYSDFVETDYETIMELEGNIDNIDAIKAKYAPLFPYDDLIQKQNAESVHPNRLYSKNVTANSVYVYVSDTSFASCYSEYFQTKSAIMRMQFNSQNPVPVFRGTDGSLKVVDGEKLETHGISYWFYEYSGNYEIRIYGDDCIFAIKTSGFEDIDGFDKESFKETAVEQYKLMKLSANND